MTLFRQDDAAARVRAAVSAIAAGRPVIVTDDADRENEGDLIFAATHATTGLVAFMVRHTSGFICVALPESECTRLGLPPMCHENEDRFRTAYCVTVDLQGTGTGISAQSRARTIAALAAPETTAADLVRPGHVVPLRAREGGVLTRNGHTEAAVDLARLAGLPPAGALCEIVSADRPGEMAPGPELQRFAAEHDLIMISIRDLISYRERTEPQVRRGASTSLPTVHGRFRAIGYVGRDGGEHVALVAGPVDRVTAMTPVYVHNECVMGDVLRSNACECANKLEDVLGRFAAQGSGLVVYLRAPGASGMCRSHEAVDPTGGTSVIAEWILADLGAVRSERSEDREPFPEIERLPFSA
ncbi:3,4-dihydroxy-2-butanone-4-phosphate synthase [Nocardia vaccinii]|uniref:3,4-dihydroxy-2-butanone-4-phosphate synthase n=1 Tax=Nocardia vaccinii TaxID=1822 RepID=UPI0008309091|nr:3,4-dihydroxy-2-butanone-4-phosphate synthase [Nocardia vaccinii]